MELEEIANKLELIFNSNNKNNKQETLRYFNSLEDYQKDYIRKNDKYYWMVKCSRFRI